MRMWFGTERTPLSTFGDALSTLVQEQYRQRMLQSDDATMKLMLLRVP